MEMSVLKNFGRDVVQMAAARPLAAASLFLLAPPLLAISVKALIAQPNPLDASSPQSASRAESAAADEDRVLDQISLLSKQLEKQTLELDRLTRTLDQLGIDQATGLIPTGPRSGSPTKSPALRRPPHLIASRVESHSGGISTGEASTRGASERGASGRGDRRGAGPVLLNLSGSSSSNRPPLVSQAAPVNPVLGSGLPNAPHGAPEIDPNLATAGILLLAGGTLALTGRRRTI